MHVENKIRETRLKLQVREIPDGTTIRYGVSSELVTHQRMYFGNRMKNDGNV